MCSDVASITIHCKHYCTHSASLASDQRNKRAKHTKCTASVHSEDPACEDSGTSDLTEISLLTFIHIVISGIAILLITVSSDIDGRFLG